MKRLRWDQPRTPLPKRPYRDSAILYGALAVIVVLVTWLTGGDVRAAVPIAAFVFVVATAWSWRAFRRRIREEERRS
jgi:membrane protein implicated in regulation of membrane protease activity